MLAGLIWLLGLTYTIVGPVVAAAIVATVAMPLVARLSQHMPRAAAAVGPPLPNPSQAAVWNAPAFVDI